MLFRNDDDDHHHHPLIRDRKTRICCSLTSCAADKTSIRVLHYTPTSTPTLPSNLISVTQTVAARLRCRLEVHEIGEPLSVRRDQLLHRIAPPSAPVSHKTLAARAPATCTYTRPLPVCVVVF